MKIPNEHPPRVCVESPYGSDDPAVVARNVEYAEACMLDSLMRGEAPFLGHLLYPRVLNDRDPEQRAQGIAGHLAYVKACHLLAVYVDRGVSPGMQEAILVITAMEKRIEYRALGGQWAQPPDDKEPPR